VLFLRNDTVMMLSLLLEWKRPCGEFPRSVVKNLDYARHLPEERSEHPSPQPLAEACIDARCHLYEKAQDSMHE
jgi:hypothetical protein